MTEDTRTAAPLATLEIGEKVSAAKPEPDGLATLGGPLPTSGGYIEALYEQWRREPESLSETWRAFFQGFDLAMCPRSCVAAERARAQSQLGALVVAYRYRGHLLARVDPLGDEPAGHADLELESYGFEEADLDRVFDASLLVGLERATLRQILDVLRETYCGSVGVEHMHIQDPDVRRWLQAEMEPVRNRPSFDRARKLGILKSLIDSEIFERFLQMHYPGQKRFSLEGAETLIPAVHALVELAPELGVEEVVIGMPHRGRLNVLANILDKSYSCIFAEFEDVLHRDRPGGDGDVKYHKGYESDHDGRLRVTLASNPSHLEAVDPVVEGRVRAKQRRRGDTAERRRVVPLLVHGDAAFSGQGLVAETLNLSQLEGYRVGGTVHLVVNNQIGFTASPDEARSSRYATDVLKMIEAPIFHVNGDDPEAVVHVVELALRFRQTFGQDVGIDLVCYRRHGHSEIDDPAFTHPVLYRKIKGHPSPRALYTARLLGEGVISEEEAARLEGQLEAKLSLSLERIDEEAPACEMEPELEEWRGLREPWSDEPIETGVDGGLLVEVAEALGRAPEGFSPSPKLRRWVERRLETVRGGGEVDWALAEALALGTLVREGTPVRLSGQDSGRGTFSQRHAVWNDVESGAEHTPGKQVHPNQATYCVYNSSLTEAAVLGFDYGYSLDSPEMLVIWEAQFGDFANGAQVVIDQFIVSSEAKWGRTSGLVLLLPHGYEGQGPEHSNAYLERYLAACAEQNIQVTSPTTPAQCFHALRRQVRRPFRRPLVVMAPKSLLRHPRCVSPLDDLVRGRFEEILEDPARPERPRRLVLCAGKVYYDLVDRRDAVGAEVEIVRVEQLYPLAEERLRRIVQRSGTDDLVWAQEEPENRGAYRSMHLAGERLGFHLRYVGRRASASPATGSLRVHREEQERLVAEAIEGSR